MKTFEDFATTDNDFSLSLILKHLEDKNLSSIHIYCIVMMSFEFSNCIKE